MAITEQVIFTNMCMVYDGERVLVQDRLDPGWKGAAFPGGHVEAGESFTDAVIREVLEETGLTISQPRLCGIKDWTGADGTRYVVLLYKTDKFTGELHASEEGDVFWLPLSEFRKIRLAEDMEEMLKVFLEDDLSEFFYDREAGSWHAALK